MRFSISMFLVVLICSCTATTSNTTYVSEVITLNIAEFETIMSENEYSGWVTIGIAGLGSTTSDTSNDAFFAFQQNGDTLPNPWTEFGIIINGFLLDCFGQVVALAQCPTISSSEHRYLFEYYVGDEPVKMRFQITDTDYQDNDGMFTVTVSTEPLFTGR
jgi:hypothetical protein